MRSIMDLMPGEAGYTEPRFVNTAKRRLFLNAQISEFKTSEHSIKVRVDSEGNYHIWTERPILGNVSTPAWTVLVHVEPFTVQGGRS